MLIYFLIIFALLAVTNQGSMGVGTSNPKGNFEVSTPQTDTSVVVRFAGKLSNTVLSLIALIFVNLCQQWVVHSCSEFSCHNLLLFQSAFIR